MTLPNDDARAFLIAEITSAFKYVLRGDGVSLHETNVLDDYGGPAARLEAREWDTDTHWWELTDADLYARHVYLSYLDAESLRYYLPAYMISCLNGADRFSKIAYFLLICDEGSSREEWKRQKWEGFSEEQGRVTCRFLRYMADHAKNKRDAKDAETALRQHWGRFCQDNTL